MIGGAGAQRIINIKYLQQNLISAYDDSNWCKSSF